MLFPFSNPFQVVPIPMFFYFAMPVPCVFLFCDTSSQSSPVSFLDRFGDHFGTSLGTFWDHFGIILVTFWDHFGELFGGWTKVAPS
jgi:hypothetical protein